ncbi:hypothetical protein [Pseudomonas reinekei]|jgi:hypothetical protein
MNQAYLDFGTRFRDSENMRLQDICGYEASGTLAISAQMAGLWRVFARDNPKIIVRVE